MKQTDLRAVQGTKPYQHRIDIAASADAHEGIRQGLDDAKHGRLRRSFSPSLKRGMAFTARESSTLLAPACGSSAQRIC